MAVRVVEFSSGRYKLELSNFLPPIENSTTPIAILSMHKQNEIEIHTATNSQILASRPSGGASEVDLDFPSFSPKTQSGFF